MKKAVFLIFLFFAATLSFGETLTWTGAASYDWNTAANWSPQQVPASYYDVVIPSGLFRYPLLCEDTGVCHDLTLQNGALIRLGDWILGSAPIHAYGNAYMAGQLQIYEPSTFRVDGNLFWQSGSTLDIIADPAYFICYGNMTMEAGSDIDFYPATVYFQGEDSSVLTNHSSTTSFYNINMSIMYPATLTVSAASTQPFLILGNLWLSNGKQMNVDYAGNVFIVGDLDCDNNTVGGLHCSAGTLVMFGYDQYMTFAGPESCLNNLVINTQNDAGLVYLYSDVLINGSLAISRGTLNAGTSTISVKGDWANNAGPAYFAESTSKVIFNGTAIQYCSHSEGFYNLEVNNTFGLRIDSGAAVTCASYDWTAGPVTVNNGSFTTDDLADNGIFGSWTVNTFGTVNITQDDTSFVDLNCDLAINGGNFNVYGGSDNSWWPYASDASLSMNGGVLDFKDQSIFIANGYDFTENITGGLIRTIGQFLVERADFNPAGGTIEIYGSADVGLFVETGSWLNKLRINKTMEKSPPAVAETVTDRFGQSHVATRSKTVTCLSPLILNDDFWLDHGTFIAPATMSVGGDWTVLSSDAAFSEGSCHVTLFGTQDCNFYASGTFASLELNKAGTAALRLGITCSLTCGSYDWTSGELYVGGGSFTALDMTDEAILGTVELTGGSITLHQDTSTYLDLGGNVTISGGSLHFYGGQPEAGCYWPFGSTASLAMSGGTIDVHDQLIYVYNSGTFTADITGGTIRTSRDFWCGRTDFTPSGGTLELYSSADCSLNMIAGSLYNLVIDKAARSGDEILPGQIPETDPRALYQGIRTRSSTVTLNLNAYCAGNITIQTGRLDCNGKNLACGGNLDVYGTLEVDAAAIVTLAGTMSLSVRSGGRLEALGTSTSSARITHSTGYYNLNVLAGGTLSANYAVFEYLRTNGVNVQPGASVDPANSFHNCTFRNGTMYGTLLTLDNGQNLLINAANFPTNTWTGNNNVRKNTDAGVVNFANAIGGFAGESYDYDLFNRILWTSPSAAYDLQIAKAAWSKSSALLGETVTCTVTYLNCSLYECYSDYLYLDLYFNPPSVPVPGQVGQQYYPLPYVPAGLPVDQVFQVTITDPDSLGIWSSWVQIDSDQYVTESNEDNNKHGPFNITWYNLPPITDLSIEYLTVSGNIRLEWSYPVPCDEFNIYASSDPCFTPGPENYITHVMYPSTVYTATPGSELFYIVTAEIVTAAKTEHPDPLVRNARQRRQ